MLWENLEPKGMAVLVGACQPESPTKQREVPAVKYVCLTVDRRDPDEISSPSQHGRHPIRIGLHPFPPRFFIDYFVPSLLSIS